MKKAEKFWCGYLNEYLYFSRVYQTQYLFTNVSGNIIVFTKDEVARDLKKCS